MKREPFSTSIHSPKLRLKSHRRDLGVSSYRATFTSLLVPLITQHWLSDEKWLNMFCSFIITWFRAEPYLLTDDSKSLLTLLKERGDLDSFFKEPE